MKAILKSFLAFARLKFLIQIEPAIYIPGLHLSFLTQVSIRKSLILIDALGLSIRVTWYSRNSQVVKKGFVLIRIPRDKN